MPRGPRLDVADALYHVIARGVERRPIFRSDDDRRDFLRRVERLVTEEDVTLFAYVLMDNHFHLVLQRGTTSLGQFMRRLLTGYSVAFNRRHRRSGHLFQNRYRSVLCDADEYLLTLVRYVHLNPIRARITSAPSAYRWSSHRLYLQRSVPEWLAANVVLEIVGGRRAFERFVREGHDEQRRDDLSGRGERGREDPGERRVWLGGQVLGSASRVRRVARKARQREAERELARGSAADLPALAAQVARRTGVTVEALRASGRPRAISAARRELIRVAVLEHGLRRVDVSRFLGVSRSSVTEQVYGKGNS